jgi:hypothetical protein
MSLNSWSGLGDRWDTQRPLDWPVATPGNPGVPLLDSVPEFRDAVREARSARSGLSDFEVIDEVARQNPLPTPHELSAVDPWGPEGEQHRRLMLLHTQMRHFLGLAYSTYELAARQVELEGWAWLTYLTSIADEFVGAVSFNYDLVLERLLDQAGSSVQGFGVHGEDPDQGVWVGKPHGSIDYDIDAPGGIKIDPPPDYPLTAIVMLNDGPIRRIPPDHLLELRTQIELVPPLSSTLIAGFQSVVLARNRFAAVGPTLDTLLVMGLSYWPCDRGEIDGFLDAVGPETQVIVANPHLPGRFVEAIESRGLRWEQWENPPA